jgi:hypothetical protein
MGFFSTPQTKKLNAKKRTISTTKSQFFPPISPPHILEKISGEMLENKKSGVYSKGCLMLHWHPIKELMHELTGLNVETTAVYELSNYFENEIKKVILQSKEELKKLNQIKEIQRVYQKKRIDRDCIKNAIKTIKENNHTPTKSLDSGGN